MKSLSLATLSLLLLLGCEATPAKYRPGAMLIGEDLPEAQRGAMAPGDTPPVPVRMQNPVYPFELRRQGITGTVVVEFIVGTDGKVRDAYAVTSPHEGLSKAAVAAILGSKYRPALKNGKPAAVKMQVPISFSL